VRFDPRSEGGGGETSAGGAAHAPREVPWRGKVRAALGGSARPAAAAATLLDQGRRKQGWRVAWRKHNQTVIHFLAAKVETWLVREQSWLAEPE
jgi:hypothetical protein